MSDLCDLPPPSYELSQQGHDQKIVEKKLQELLLSKIPIHDVEEEHDGDDSKDSKETETQKEKQPLFQTLVQPLHIQKRTPRGSRPLPPSPADAQSRSKAIAIHPTGPVAEEIEYQPVLSPPPPFTAVGPSFDGPPYEYSMYHASGSAAPSPLSTPNRASFNPPTVRRGQQRPFSSFSPAEPHAETSYRRISHGAYLEPSSSRTFTPPASRLSFDPSIAYATLSNAMYDPWERTSDSTAVDPTSLYSSAVSSYLNPTSAVNQGPRSSYIGAKSKNRYSMSPRPSSSVEMLTPGGSPGAPALQFHSPYAPAYSASHQSLPPYARPKSSQGGHVRWATSESDFMKDIYP
ncbi:uncharacterized protein EDB91DRAFT_434472 [Suillus paluster]|uniref:uncharacterized protein n=1 Tax=Suillus paluster TaxID=48578 RepID=UPI001B87D910|nr:uncharacterized protein EDB91DRAFT_434472 [Suillus paluster]KAG1754066.1 hypothetical protein EDB91DRAFT_434472 [Suillus paluster]